MTSLRIEVTVIAETACSVGAGGSAGTLADKSIARDGWGRPIIPGSQVKGRVRHAAEWVVQALGLPIQRSFDDDDPQNDNIIRGLFGSPDRRSPLHFANLPGVIGSLEQIDAVRHSVEQRQSKIRPSVSLNRRRGIAEDARLLFQETTLEGIRFYSTHAIIGDIASPSHAALLWAALKLSNRWGGATSRGLGWASVETRVHFGTQQLGEADLQQALRDLNQTRSS